MDWSAYAALYPDGPGEERFERLAWEARRIMDRATTGVDGVRKLTAAPPTAPEAVLAVDRCQAALIHRLWQMEQEESYVNREDGTVAGRVVTTVTAGSESVIYAAPRTGQAAPADRAEELRALAAGYLDGVPDGNGVNLTYMGRYPIGTERAGEDGV